MRVTLVQSLLPMLLLAGIAGCAALPSVDHGLTEDLPRTDAQATAEDASASAVDQLKAGEYCRFVYTDPSKARRQMKMAGRVVSVVRGSVVLTDVVEIIDPWTPSPKQRLRSPSQDSKNRKQIALQPMSDRSDKEFVIALRQINHVETMDREAWSAFCESAFRKPAPVDFSFNVRPM